MTLANPSQVGIEIYDAKGNLSHRERFGETSAGPWRLDLRGKLPSNRLSIVRATFGEAAQTFQHLPLMTFEADADITLDASIPAGFRLAKLAAPVAFAERPWQPVNDRLVIEVWAVTPGERAS